MRADALRSWGWKHPGVWLLLNLPGGQAGGGDAAGRRQPGPDRRDTPSSMLYLFYNKKRALECAFQGGYHSEAAQTSPARGGGEQRPVQLLRRFPPLSFTC